jgi:hydrogenase expression/formation protein HypD
VDGVTAPNISLAEQARGWAQQIAAAASPQRRYVFMDYCGGHTFTMFHHGLQDLLPGNITMVHGPGCPVCVLPTGRVDMAIELARRTGVTLCSYGDVLRVPGSNQVSLRRARAEGADVRMVYSVTDALRLAEQLPERQVVFLAIGFETTTPPTAVAVKQAQERGLRNFSVLCNHVLTPAAIAHVLDSPELRQWETVRLDGFIGPGHVGVIIGTQPFEFFAEEYAKPVVIAGFEPLDILQAIAMLVGQVNDGRAEVENEYPSAVTRDGNRKAQALVAEVFELRRWFEWRGLGRVPYSGLQLKQEFAAFDAERRFALRYVPAPDQKGCECGAVLRGVLKPTDCRLFGTVCTPENPMGSCMVSGEGACAAYYRYRRFAPA